MAKGTSSEELMTNNVLKRSFMEEAQKKYDGVTTTN